MDSEEMKERAKLELEPYLNRRFGVDTSRNFSCPFHEDKNPSMSFDRNRNKVHCFSCGFDGDVFDLIGRDYNLTGADIFTKGYAVLGIHQDTMSKTPTQPEIITREDEEIKMLLSKSKVDKDNPNAIKYLNSRGISIESANRLGIGYLENCKALHPISQAIIIPRGVNAFTARNINPCADSERIRKRGHQTALFGVRAFEHTQPIFVVEGEIDALSVEECGYRAIALGSVTNVRNFIDAYKKHSPTAMICVSLDNDDSGKKATQELQKELNILGAKYVTCNISGEYKDPNERLVYDRAGLEKALAEAVKSEPFPVPKGKRLNTITAKELKAKNLPPIQYIIPGILPYGLNLLAGKPKVKKSWLASDLAIATAKGSAFLGKEANRGEVLCLALEDSENRIQDRQNKLLPNENPPEGLTFTNEASTIKDGILEELDNYIIDNPSTKLIVIDTLEYIRGGAGKGENAYSYDVRELKELSKFAKRHSLCILLIHHERKAIDKTDPFANILGSNGIRGTVDTMWVLSEIDGRVTLHIKGRDIDDYSLAMEFDKTIWRWRVLGNAEDEEKQLALTAYQNCPVVETIMHKLSTEKTWKATAQEIQHDIHAHIGGFVPEAVTPEKLSRYLKSIQSLLRTQDNIIYSRPPKNGVRGIRWHSFSKIITKPDIQIN